MSINVKFTRSNVKSTSNNVNFTRNNVKSMSNNVNFTSTIMKFTMNNVKSTLLLLKSTFEPGSTVRFSPEARGLKKRPPASSTRPAVGNMAPPRQVQARGIATAVPPAAICTPVRCN